MRRRGDKPQHHRLWPLRKLRAESPGTGRLGDIGGYVDNFVDNSTVLGIGGVEGQKVKGGFAGKRRSTNQYALVSEDQMFNASRLSETAPKGRAVPVSLIQKLNTQYGTRAVSDALRYMRLDPPRDPAAYLVAMLRAKP